MFFLFYIYLLFLPVWIRTNLDVSAHRCLVSAGLVLSQVWGQTLTRYLHEGAKKPSQCLTADRSHRPGIQSVIPRHHTPPHGPHPGEIGSVASVL